MRAAFYIYIHTSNAEFADAAAKLFIQKENYTHSFTMKSVYIFNVRRGVQRYENIWPLHKDFDMNIYTNRAKRIACARHRR